MPLRSRGLRLPVARPSALLAVSALGRRASPYLHAPGRERPQRRSLLHLRRGQWLNPPVRAPCASPVAAARTFLRDRGRSQRPCPLPAAGSATASRSQALAGARCCFAAAARLRRLECPSSRAAFGCRSRGLRPCSLSRRAFEQRAETKSCRALWPRASYL